MNWATRPVPLRGGSACPSPRGCPRVEQNRRAGQQTISDVAFGLYWQSHPIFTRNEQVAHLAGTVLKNPRRTSGYGVQRRTGSRSRGGYRPLPRAPNRRSGRRNYVIATRPAANAVETCHAALDCIGSGYSLFWRRYCASSQLRPICGFPSQAFIGISYPASLCDKGQTQWGAKTCGGERRTRPLPERGLQVNINVA